jgi:hypothetical protein
MNGTSPCPLVQAHPSESHRRRWVQSHCHRESLPPVSSTLQPPSTSMRPSLTSSFIPGAAGTLTHRRRPPERHCHSRKPPPAAAYASSSMIGHPGELRHLYGCPAGVPFLGGAHPGYLTVQESLTSPPRPHHRERRVRGDCPWMRPHGATSMGRLSNLSPAGLGPCSEAVRHIFA